MADFCEENKGNPAESLLNTATINGHRNSVASAFSPCARSQRDLEDCGSRIPKNRLTFFSQIIVVYGIIAVSVYHLSVQSPNQELWLVLLSSAFGYILPSPGLKYLKRPKPHTDLSRSETRSEFVADFVDGVIVEERGNESSNYSKSNEDEQ